MDTSTASLMPMPGAVKGALPMGAPALPPTPLPIGPMPGGPAQAGPLPMGPGAPQAAPAGPLPMPLMGAVMPPAPAKPPYDVELQDNGTAAFFITDPVTGKKTYLGIADPPKVPKALQQPGAPAK